MKRTAKRVLSLLLAVLTLTAGVPAHALESEAETPNYTAEEIHQLLDAVEVPEKMEAGMFSFAAEAYAVRRTEAEFQIPLLRYGPCEGEGEVALTLGDINATYGVDYLLEIDGEALSAEEGAMQLIATEDKHDSGDILLTEENLQAMEDQEEDPQQEEVLEPEGTPEPEIEESVPALSLPAIKEELFGRQLSQTDSFYGDSQDPGETAAKPLELPPELQALQSVCATVRFVPGERYKMLTVKLLPDSTSAGDESFQLALSTVTEKTGLGDCPTAVVVLKHEGKLEQSVVGFADTEISARGGLAEVSVVREKGEYNAAVVSFSTSAGTLEPGSGYSPTSETLLFLPGETEKTVLVPLMDTAGGGSFSCQLSDPQGATLSVEEVTVTVAEERTPAGRTAADELKETWAPSALQSYVTVGSAQWLSPGNFYSLENRFADANSSTPVCAIATANRKVSGVAYKKVTVHFDSFGEYNSCKRAWKYNRNDRRANTLTTSLWNSSAQAQYIGVPWRPAAPAHSQPMSSGLYSQWFHPGIGSEDFLESLSDSITIPDSGYTDSYTLALQQRHFHPWLAIGAIHVTSIELDRRQLRFQYLPHDPFYRRLGSLATTEAVNNIFQLTATAGRNENSTYVIGDTVGYSAQAAAQDPLYKYMMTLGRHGGKDKISAMATGGAPKELQGNSGFTLNDAFFEKYGGAFAQDGYGSSNKVAYIKPAYDKEKWRVNLTLEQTADGAAELGFLNSGSTVAPLNANPAYLSEEVTLRATPKPGLYVKGYRMEYQDYDGATRRATVELSEKELTGYQGKQRDIRVPLRYSTIKITPIYTSLPARRITVTVDPATRQYGDSFPEGVQEAHLDALGNRIGELEMGHQIVEIATAQPGYIPVWTRDGVTYSGESYDFEIGATDVNIQIELSFQAKGAVYHTITGTLREPDVNINNLLATNFGVTAPKVPLAGATVATGLASVKSGEDGAFQLYSSPGVGLYSIAGTLRTVRIIRNGECSIHTVKVPASGSADMGTIDLPLAPNLPYQVGGTIVYTKADSQGNLNTYESKFGGIGQDNSNLFRYDAAEANVTGAISWIGGTNTTYSSCELIFTDKNGLEVSRIRPVKDVSGDFSFHLNPVQNTSAGGGVYLSLKDDKGNAYGPYDTGIVVSNPPSGDVELMEGPSMEIPIADIDLPIVQLTKPSFSSGLIQGSFSSKGLNITVGFDVKEMYDTIKKNHKEWKDNKEGADAVSKEAKKQNDASSAPKAKRTTGKVTAELENISFACTLSFAFFDSDGKVLAQQEPGAVLAIYNAFFYLGGSGKAAWEIASSIYGIPVYIELSGKASVAIIISLSAENESGKKSHFPLKTFNEDPTTLKAEGLVPVNVGLGLEAGIGRKRVMALYVGGSMDLNFNWLPWNTGTGTLGFSVGCGLSVFGQKLGMAYNFPLIPLFDTTSVNPDYSEEPPDREAVSSAQTPNFDFDFSKVDTGGLQAGEVTLVEGILHDAHPRIADIGDGNTMLVFLSDAPGRNGVNRTALYYSIFDGTTAAEPVLIDGDGTLDASPDVMDLGDKVLIVWSDSCRDDFGETAEVRDIMASMDIHGVFYDKAKGTLGEEFSITSDSREESDSLYLPADSQPAICYDEAAGTVGVYFIKEDFGLLDTDGEETVQEFMNGQTTAAYCPIDVENETVSLDYLPEEGVPERFQAVLSGQRLLDVGLNMPDNGLSDPKIESFAVGTAGNYTVFAYPVDLDQSGGTTDDQMLFAVLIDQSTGRRYAPICLTAEPAALGAPRFVRNEMEVEGESYRTSHLVWQSGEKLLCCDMESLMENVSFEGGVCTLDEGFTPVEYAPGPTDTFPIGNDSLVSAASDGGIYTVTTLQDGENSEIAVQYYTGEYTRGTSESEEGSASYVVGNGQWSRPVQVTRADRENSQQHILLKDAVTAQDGSLLLLCDRFDGMADTGNLNLLKIVPSPSLAPNIDVSIDRDYPHPGDTVQVSAVVQSTGLLDSEDVTVVFSLEDGSGSQPAEIGSWTGTIPAGGEARAAVEWSVPEDLAVNSKIIASTSQAEGELALPRGEAISVDNVTYRYLSDSETESKLAVSVDILNRGNVTPDSLSLQICSVDNAELTAGISDKNASPEDAYTVLATLPVESPFADGDYSSQECAVTLPQSADGMPRELLVRALSGSGERYELASEFLPVMPPTENAPLKERAPSNPTTTTTVKNEDGSTTTTVTDSKTGAVTETTQWPDGTELKITTQKSGEQRISVVIPKNRDMATVSIPVKELTPGTVAVIVHPDGTEEVVKRSVAGKGGLVVTLRESAELKIIDNTKHFDDVGQGQWYSGNVAFAASRELFYGTSETVFSPELPMTRAMLMTVLARLDGQDTAGGGNWYSKAMKWAMEQGISDGSNPNDSITREQLAAMLYRYAGSPAASGTLEAFTDARQASAWATDALRWAVEQGIIAGKGNGILDPKGKATRAEVAAMLQRFCENPAKKNRVGG